MRPTSPSPVTRAAPITRPVTRSAGPVQARALAAAAIRSSRKLGGILWITTDAADADDLATALAKRAADFRHVVVDGALAEFRAWGRGWQVRVRKVGGR